MSRSHRAPVAFTLALFALCGWEAGASSPAAQPRAADEYPATEVLAAFEQACGSIASLDATASNVIQAGWTISDGALPQEMTQFLQFAETEGKKLVESKDGQFQGMRVFENSIDGEKVYIVLSEVAIEGIRVTGCRLFDLGENRAITTHETQQWLGRPPTKVQSHPEIQVADWEPGLRPQHDTFQLFHVPPGSPVADVVKFTGIALKADTVGPASE